MIAASVCSVIMSGRSGSVFCPQANGTTPGQPITIAAAPIPAASARRRETTPSTISGNRRDVSLCRFNDFIPLSLRIVKWNLAPSDLDQLSVTRGRLRGCDAASTRPDNHHNLPEAPMLAWPAISHYTTAQAKTQPAGAPPTLPRERFVSRRSGQLRTRAGMFVAATAEKVRPELDN
ncbi:MAG: hypothetical protein WD875_14435 [Pirellulales bacterium]